MDRRRRQVIRRQTERRAADAVFWLFALVLDDPAASAREVHRLSGRRGEGVTLFPEAAHVEEIPVTPALRIRQFVTRNAYNATHAERLERELRELLAAFGCAEAKA